VANLNDGSLGITTGNHIGSVAFTASGTWTTTFALDLSVNTNGYDITSINSIAGWTDVRIDQKYTLLYSTAAAPTTFISLGTFTYSPAGQTGTSDRSSEITLTATGLTNVAALQFNFQTPGGYASDETTYREIDAFGVASPLAVAVVPEPSAYALILCGFGALIAFQRLRRPTV
jgi:hypothetical protein